MRAGLMAKKLGMTQLFLEDGTQVAVSVLQVSPHTVIAQRLESADGYNAVQLGCCDLKPHKVTKPLKGHYARLEIAPKKHVKEFRVDADSLLEKGTEVGVTHFAEGQWVDVRGITIGKGFAGAMKRHGFGGLRASHGVSVSHRSHGSTGNRTDPGKVFKNKKMAGQMGAVNVTKLNLYVQKIDLENGLLFIKGAVPGPKGGLLTVRDAIKKKHGGSK